MRIIHVITGLETGGAEAMLYKLLRSRGSHDSIVVSLTVGGRYTHEIQSIGVPVYNLGMKRGSIGIMPLLHLRRLLLESNPDVVQGWMYHANLAATLAVMLARIKAPVFWNIRQSLYDIDAERWLTRYVIRLAAWLSSRAHSIIYNSRLSQEQHENIGFNSTRSRWIANGFDCSLFSPQESARSRLRAELKIETDTILIGMVARYHPMKDHRTFLAAASILCQQYSRICFLLIGRGVDNENMQLRNSLAEFAPHADIRLLGERHDLPNIYPALDIATLSSSRGEAFPNVIGEAMACGVPCVATDIGECSAIIGNTGLIVPPKNAARLAAAWKTLIRLTASERNSLSVSARERIERLFSIEAISKEYYALYHATLPE